MDLLETIKSRRSIRKFSSVDVGDVDLMRILEAGRWAPSGLNNQPWRFLVFREDEVKEEAAKLTHYGRIIRDASVNIAVFSDESAAYDQTKDLLAIGACIQNMLLEAHSIGLGAVWLGEILKNKELFSRLFNIPHGFELMAVVAIGHRAEEGKIPERKPVKDLLF